VLKYRKPTFPEDYIYKTIPVDDIPFENLLPHFESGVDFIADALKGGDVENNSVFVHCQMGISRSASFVIAYLIREKGMSY